MDRFVDLCTTIRQATFLPMSDYRVVNNTDLAERAIDFNREEIVFVGGQICISGDQSEDSEKVDNSVDIETIISTAWCKMQDYVDYTGIPLLDTGSHFDFNCFLRSKFKK